MSVIIVSFKSDEVIHDCIKSIDSDIEIIVVDNSNDMKFKENIERKYKNTKCFLSGSNIGMGAGNNLGINKSNKDYALILNPDVRLEFDALNEIIEASKKLDDFGLIAPISSNFKYPNYKSNTFNNVEPFEVNSVDGYAMLLNLKKLKKIKNFNFFDENFFLYLENDDLCKNLKKNNESIYIIPRSKIKHLGGKAVDSKYEIEIEYSRNWHWMWSKFYFNKKHYGFLIGILKILKNLTSAILKFFFYLILFNSHKRKIYQMRLSGLYNSIIGKKSFYRPKINN